MNTIRIIAILLVFIVVSPTWAATIDDVIFLRRIQVYETIVATTLVTQEGKRISLDKGTKVSVAGFTATEALVLTRSDRPTGFIRKEDIAPSASRSGMPEPPVIKEETLP